MTWEEFMRIELARATLALVLMLRPCICAIR